MLRTYTQALVSHTELVRRAARQSRCVLPLWTKSRSAARGRKQKRRRLSDPDDLVRLPWAVTQPQGDPIDVFHEVHREDRFLDPDQVPVAEAKIGNEPIGEHDFNLRNAVD